MSRRGGPAQCFNCGLWSDTPAEWKAHHRKCGSVKDIYKKMPPLQLVGSLLPEPVPLKQMHNPVFDLLFENVWVSPESSLRYKRIFARHRVLEIQDLRTMAPDAYEAFVTELDSGHLRSRIVRLRGGEEKCQ